MVEFKRTGDADYPRWLKIVNMANAKAGKTTFEATAPNVAILATPNCGLMSIAHLNVPFMAIDHSEKLKQAIMILGSDALRQRAAEELAMPKIESVALDLFDDVQRMLQKERLRAERRTQFQRDDWGWLLEQQREIMSSLMALPLNVIVSVHVKSTQDDENRMIVGPQLQGGFADEIAGYPDFVIMSQRTREVDPATGQPFTQFSLRVEGDTKNPNLGNRAAGRLPEVCEPNFQVLHDAVFKGIDTLQKHEAVTLQTGVTNEETVATSQEVAQTAGQSEQAQPAATTAQPAAAAPAESGQPAAPTDEGDPINEAGIKHMTNFYKDAGFNAPNFDGWTLGEARATARMFVAVKADLAEGKETWDTMAQFLQGVQADKPYQVWAGKIGEEVPEVAAAPPTADPAPVAEASAEAPVEAVPTPVQNEAPTAPAAEAPVTPVEASADVTPSPEPPAGSAVTAQPSEAAEVAAPAPAAPAGDRAATEAEAIQTIQDKLGGVVVEDESTPCVICNGKINDIDIARLAKARFNKWACVDDYVALTKQ